MVPRRSRSARAEKGMTYTEFTAGARIHSMVLQSFSVSCLLYNFLTSSLPSPIIPGLLFPANSMVKSSIIEAWSTMTNHFLISDVNIILLSNVAFLKGFSRKMALKEPESILTIISAAPKTLSGSRNSVSIYGMNEGMKEWMNECSFILNRLTTWSEEAGSSENNTSLWELVRVGWLPVPLYQALRLTLSFNLMKSFQRSKRTVAANYFLSGFEPKALWPQGLCFFSQYYFRCMLYIYGTYTVVGKTN